MEGGPPRDPRGFSLPWSLPAALVPAALVPAALVPATLPADWPAESAPPCAPDSSGSLRTRVRGVARCAIGRLGPSGELFEELRCHGPHQIPSLTQVAVGRKGEREKILVVDDANDGRHLL